MITIFDELSDYGYPQKLIHRLKDEWLARLSEFEIQMIFEDNPTLLHKLMACVPTDAMDKAIGRFMIQWQKALLTDSRWLKYHPAFKEYEYKVKFGVDGSVTDPRDGRVYKTVQLSACTIVKNKVCANAGSGKIWLAENLMFKSDDGFYSFDTAREVCLPGWHLPTKEDVADLQNFCDLYIGEDAPKCLKSTDGWDYNNGIDALGFNALPKGYIDYENDLVHTGNTAAFWLGQKKGDNPYSLSITDYSENLPGEIAAISDKYKLSVRLVKD